jgi:branched-chain amino acid aminotransferase
MKPFVDAKRSFGSRTTARVLVRHFAERRWSEARLEPAAALALHPLTQVLHYGASVFEGLKAHRQPDGSLALFRPREHIARLNRSAERLCLPTVDEGETLADLAALVRAEAAEAPSAPGALYVRPLLFSEDAALGYSTPERAWFVTMLVPVQPLFKEARLRTETEYVRAAPGGTGAAKCAGNYAGALLAQKRALAENFTEVLWLDARERRWIEEAGGMNVMFVRSGVLTTPPLGDTILAGVTRASLLALARDLGIPAEERPISVDEDWSGVSEAFMSGTAAGTAHIRTIVHRGKTLFARPEPGPIAARLGPHLERLKFGHEPDPHGWRYRV